MKLPRLAQTAIMSVLIGLTGCTADPDNNYQLRNHAAEGAVIGGLGGAAFGSFTTYRNVPISIGIGAGVGALAGYVIDSDLAVVRRLANDKVRLIVIGSEHTLVIPTDHFFYFNTAEIDPFRYNTMNDIVRLLTKFSHSKFTIDAYTDNVANEDDNLERSRRQAEAIKGYLWSHGISQRQIRLAGRGAQWPLVIHRDIARSSFNRHVTIQWRG